MTSAHHPAVPYAVSGVSIAPPSRAEVGNTIAAACHDVGGDAVTGLSQHRPGDGHAGRRVKTGSSGGQKSRAGMPTVPIPRVT